VKLLKLILITIIFFQATVIVFSKNRECHSDQLCIKRDSVKHPQQNNKTWITVKLKDLKKKKQEYPDDDCLLTNTYSAAKRLQRYPFSKAVKILAVSYPWNIAEDDTIGAIKRPDTVFISDLHVINGKLNYTSLKEIQILDSVEINELTTIIYNSTYTKRNSKIMNTGYKCFYARNALIFYDKSGKVFDYLEVCFECMGFQSESGKITIGTYCNQKYDLLREFFLRAGLKYGTIDK